MFDKKWVHALSDAIFGRFRTCSKLKIFRTLTYFPEKNSQENVRVRNIIRVSLVILVSLYASKPPLDWSLFDVFVWLSVCVLHRKTH